MTFGDVLVVVGAGLLLAGLGLLDWRPPVAMGALWRIVGRVVGVGDASHSANDKMAPEYQNL